MPIPWLTSRKKCEVRIHFNDGPFVENVSKKRTIVAVFSYAKKVEYSVTLRPGEWGKCFRRYYTNWNIDICDTQDNLLLTKRFDLKHQTVRINIDSKSLGDTLAWIPQIDAFSKAHPKTNVYCAHFFEELGFDQTYPNLTFINPSSALDNVYATYSLGYYSDEVDSYHPQDPRTVPLGQIAADILGIPYVEIRPKLPGPTTDKTITGKYVCMATTSTAGCKLWHRKDGWQKVINFLNDNGLRPVLVQKEPASFEGVINKSGDIPLKDRITDIVHCEFFIGLGSGLSWLAWGLGKNVILISGFSKPYTEFSTQCERVINEEVCHGCWNSTEYIFDRGDWNWCPRHKDTPRQFECSTAITEDMVIQRVRKLMKSRR